MRYIIIVLLFFSSRSCNSHGGVFVWRPGRRTAPVMIPNALRFLIEVLFYLVRRSPDYISRIRSPIGRFLFRRVSLFVTRSILTISECF